jgi:uncharacterized protein (TIGR03382 family)
MGLKNRRHEMRFNLVLVYSAVALGSLSFMVSTSEVSAEEVIQVPYSWSVERTGDPFASVFVENTGGIGNSISDTDSLAGSFKITLNHTPPESFIERLDDLPTEVTLSISSLWTGTLSNSTLALDPFGLTIDTHIRASANMAVAGGFPAFNDVEIGGASTADINQLRTLALTVGEGSVAFAGSLDLDTLFGFGSGFLGDFAIGAASLEVSGSLLNSTGTIGYVIPAPGSLALLGVAGLIGRRRRLIH